MDDFEKLGVFYLGREYDTTTRQPRNLPLLYDSKDMVTHGVCLGMTGSGKTGLCLAMLEEAAIDGIPIIAIDPKGDIPNLLLTFPELAAEDFRPWINEEDARKKALDPDAYAKQQAEFWRDGLGKWGQDGERIRKLREAAEFTVYTPGSTAGVPVSILESFAAPGPQILADSELLGEHVSVAVSSLLGLLGIDADPIKSREHILLATIFESAWRNGTDLDLAGIILAIQNPPVTRVGVLELESFFPAADRFTLALALNNLMASPGFSAWLTGVGLDMQKILYSPQGKPRVAIFYIAHLGDAERMFFVSLLLNQIVSWIRRQSGTTSLRALVYMDEIFGFFPPVANPPSKKPLLTLLKQARAYGVGILLATQNPVDLDYKGLANTGTWFIGRLQTERDKARVLEALEGVASGAQFDRSSIERMLSGLGNRVFIMHNTHEDHPIIFETRWVMSYLCGPLARDQIKLLMNPTRDAYATPAADNAAGPRPGRPPVLPAEIRPLYAPVRKIRPADHQLFLVPALLGAGTVHIAETKSGIDQILEPNVTIPLPSDPAALDWNTAQPLGTSLTQLESNPPAEAYFAEIPAGILKPRVFSAAEKEFAMWLFRSQKIDLLRSTRLDRVSLPGESERDFRVRIAQEAREVRDRRIEELRRTYAPRLKMQEERIRTAQEALEREKSDAQEKRFQSFVSFGMAVLSGVFGRRKITPTNMGRAATAARGISRTMKAGDDVARAQVKLEERTEDLEELKAELEAAVEELRRAVDPLTEPLEEIVLRPKKAACSVKIVSLLWLPHWRAPDGTMHPAWRGQSGNADIH